MLETLLNRSWAEVDLDAIAANARSIRTFVRRGAEVMGVVKADAYGHGVDEVVPVLLANGVSRLAVSMLDEAIQLRSKGVEAPILVLGYTDPRRADEILRYRVTQTVFSLDLAQALSDAAVRQDSEVRVHVKVDTGMGRLGFQAGFDAVKSVLAISALPHMVVEGMYTHFASADEEDASFTQTQFERFRGIGTELGRIGIHIPIQHMCNSAALARFPSMHLDLVRPGLALYGLAPKGCPGFGPGGLLLSPAMSLKSNIVLVKDVEPGTPISYGRRFVAARPTRIGTIPIGYADGYTRSLGGQADVLVRGCRAPVVGRVCMDTCMADLTDLPDPPETGDEVVLFGSQGSQRISADEIADLTDTISYEVVCLVGKRVPRAYFQRGSLKSIRNQLV
jgi:alanine racemase